MSQSGNNKDQAFAHWVRRRMELLGLRTLRDLATQVGVTERTVSDMINRPNRKRDPSLLIWLARVLLVSPEELDELRVGSRSDVPADHRVAWKHHEANVPGLSEPLNASWQGFQRAIEAADRDPTTELENAINLYVSLVRTIAPLRSSANLSSENHATIETQA